VAGVGIGGMGGGSAGCVAGVGETGGDAVAAWLAPFAAGTALALAAAGQAAALAIGEMGGGGAGCVAGGGGDGDGGGVGGGWAAAATGMVVVLAAAGQAAVLSALTPGGLLGGNESNAGCGLHGADDTTSKLGGRRMLRGGGAAGADWRERVGGGADANDAWRRRGPPGRGSQLMETCWRREAWPWGV